MGCGGGEKEKKRGCPHLCKKVDIWGDARLSPNFNNKYQSATTQHARLIFLMSDAKKHAKRGRKPKPAGLSDYCRIYRSFSAVKFENFCGKNSTSGPVKIIAGCNLADVAFQIQSAKPPPHLSNQADVQLFVAVLFQSTTKIPRRVIQQPQTAKQ